MNEINEFIQWYDNRSEGHDKKFFTINKNANIKPFLNRKEYVIFDNIYMFEVNEYESSNN